MKKPVRFLHGLFFYSPVGILEIFICKDNGGSIPIPGVE